MLDGLMGTWQQNPDPVAQAQAKVDKAYEAWRDAKGEFRDALRQDTRRKELLKDGVTVKFAFDPRKEFYVAVRIKDGWHVSGSARTLTDDEFLSWVSGTKVQIMTTIKAV